MRNIFKRTLSFTLILSIVYLPVAYQYALADEIDTVCKQALADAEAKKSTEGDQHMAFCVQADLARQAKNVETVKSVIFLAGAVVCTTMAILENAYPAALVTGPVAKATCMATSIGGTAAGLAADIIGGVIMNNSREKYGQAKDQVCNISQFTPIVMQLAPLLNTTGGGGGEGDSGCIMCAVMMGLTGATSVVSAVSSKNSEDALVDSAKNVKDASKVSVTSLRTSQVNANQQHANNPTSAPTNNTSSDPCANQSGNAWLSCFGNNHNSPEIMALSNSPEFLNQMQKSLKGKSLGDFVKGYDGKSDLASYVAGGLGVSPALVAGVMKNNEKMAKDTNYMDKYSPITYARGGAKPSVGGGGLDFSKLMAGMMGKLDPKGKDEKKDPSELVFRQLELLPADKIYANKDISLFARIAFRYRKNTPNVEQLNWAREENKGPAPASAQQKK